MKPTLEQLTTGIESSVSITELSMNRFDGPYHFHPEVELTWIRKSSGKRFVGGKISDYEPGDLVLLGANIPHCWQSMNEVLPGQAKAIVIQFRPDFAGKSFLELPELIKIKELIEKAKAGISIHGQTRMNILHKIQQCLSSDKLHKLLLLIEILDLIASSDETDMIDEYYPVSSTLSADNERFQKIFNYLIEHYQHEISLEKVAGIAHLTPTAFCRYFKSVTRKTLVEMLIELRMNHACRLLRNTAKQVNEISIESGFGNLSYFNKTFKSITGYTPLQYRYFYLVRTYVKIQ